MVVEPFVNMSTLKLTFYITGVFVYCCHFILRLKSVLTHYAHGTRSLPCTACSLPTCPQTHPTETCALISKLISCLKLVYGWITKSAYTQIFRFITVRMSCVDFRVSTSFSNNMWLMQWMPLAQKWKRSRWETGRNQRRIPPERDTVVKDVLDDLGSLFKMESTIHIKAHKLSASSPNISTKPLLVSELELQEDPYLHQFKLNLSSAAPFLIYENK